jgi:hypothetical protein
MMMLDVLVGLALVSALAATLIVLSGRQRRVSDGLADVRAAGRAAEAALADLQAGRPPKAVPGEGLAFARATTEGADAVPAGRAWVTVRATVNGRSAALIGLVPDGEALKGALRQSPATAAGPTTRPRGGPQP